MGILFAFECYPFDRPQWPLRLPIGRKAIDQMIGNDDPACISEAIEPARGVDHIAYDGIVKPLRRANIADDCRPVRNVDAHANVEPQL